MDPLEPLHDAVQRNAAAVLALPIGAGMEHQKTRFLGAAGGEGFWIATSAGCGAALDELIASGSLVGVAFRAASLKHIFTVPIARRDAYAVNSVHVPALLLPYPEHVRAVQRREHYRVIVADGSDLESEVWTMPRHATLADKPQPNRLVHGRVRNVSAGGIGLICPAPPAGGAAPHEGDRLRVRLVYQAIEALVEGTVRFVKELPSGSVRVGIRFSGSLQHGWQGRQSLVKVTTIVGELQREEARRMRLGIAPPVDA